MFAAIICTKLNGFNFGFSQLFWMWLTDSPHLRLLPCSGSDSPPFWFELCPQFKRKYQLWKLISSFAISPARNNLKFSLLVNCNLPAYLYQITNFFFKRLQMYNSSHRHLYRVLTKYSVSISISTEFLTSPINRKTSLVKFNSKFTATSRQNMVDSDLWRT